MKLDHIVTNDLESTIGTHEIYVIGILGRDLRSIFGSPVKFGDRKTWTIKFNDGLIATLTSKYHEKIFSYTKHDSWSIGGLSVGHFGSSEEYKRIWAIIEDNSF